MPLEVKAAAGVLIGRIEHFDPDELYWAMVEAHSFTAEVDRESMWV